MTCARHGEPPVRIFGRVRDNMPWWGARVKRGWGEVLPLSGTVLISGGHEETHWRAAIGARIEFRGARRERGGGAHSGRPNCDCGEQSRGRRGDREGAAARD